jgi:hypothetical protein
MPTPLFLIVLFVLSILLPYLGSKLMAYTGRAPLRSFFGLVLVFVGLAICWRFHRQMFGMAHAYPWDVVSPGMVIMSFVLYCGMMADFDAKPDQEAIKI